jgi:hypothetical protein
MERPGILHSLSMAHMGISKSATLIYRFPMREKPCEHKQRQAKGWQEEITYTYYYNKE